MKRLLAVFLFGAISVQAQTSTSGATMPETCAVGDVFRLTTGDTLGLYNCPSSNAMRLIHPRPLRECSRRLIRQRPEKPARYFAGRMRGCSSTSSTMAIFQTLRSFRDRRRTKGTASDQEAIGNDPRRFDFRVWRELSVLPDPCTWARTDSHGDR